MLNSRAPTHGCDDPPGADEIVPLERMRIGRIESRHTLCRRFEMIEAVFLDERGELRAEACRACGLVHDHASARLAYGFRDRLDIERHDRTQVDQLRIDIRFRDAASAT